MYGSWSADGSVGAGIILRDVTGNIIFSFCRTLSLLEMDSISVVNLIKDDDHDRSVFASLVAEIKYLLSLYKTCIKRKVLNSWL